MGSKSLIFVFVLGRVYSLHLFTLGVSLQFSFDLFDGFLVFFFILSFIFSILSSLVDLAYFFPSFLLMLGQLLVHFFLMCLMLDSLLSITFPIFSTIFISLLLISISFFLVFAMFSPNDCYI